MDIVLNLLFSTSIIFCFSESWISPITHFCFYSLHCPRSSFFIFLIIFCYSSSDSSSSQVIQQLAQFCQCRCQDFTPQPLIWRIRIFYQALLLNSSFKAPETRLTLFLIYFISIYAIRYVTAKTFRDVSEMIAQVMFAINNNLQLITMQREHLVKRYVV